MKKLLWFRRDLRVQDSMLLAQEGDVLPLFIFDPCILNNLDKNDRRVSFIFDSIIELKEHLQRLGLDLAIFYGTPFDVFTYLKAKGYSDVYASVDYDLYATERDEKISTIMNFHPLHDCFLFEPNEVLKSDGTPYLVFTPYYRACQKIYTKFHVLEYVKSSHHLDSFDYDHMHCIQADACHLAPISLENIGFEKASYTIPSAKTLLQGLREKIDTYQEERDYLHHDATSKLGVHLRFGTISIREVVRFLIELKKEGYTTEPFFRQLIFREFYAYLLYHFPTLATKNYRLTLPIEESDEKLHRFYSAQTGYPIIDAAIRELLETGYMHNRARMIVGSFFTKHLLLPWQKGEAFFAKHLLDYEASSNILSWQWCAGTGIDPQPYFRIFNPFTQGEKFDKHAEYIKRYLPEVKSVPSAKLHKESYLQTTKILGYPSPIVEHDKARKRFLSYFNA